MLNIYPYSSCLRQPCFELANYYFVFHIKYKQVGSEREIKNYAELNKKIKGQFLK
jgi:hypothetical protein